MRVQHVWAKTGTSPVAFHNTTADVPLCPASERRSGRVFAKIKAPNASYRTGPRVERSGPVKLNYPKDKPRLDSPPARSAHQPRNGNNARQRRRGCTTRAHRSRPSPSRRSRDQPGTTASADATGSASGTCHHASCDKATELGNAVTRPTLRDKPGPRRLGEAVRRLASSISGLLAVGDLLAVAGLLVDGIFGAV
jgi:hypothetical protein